MDIAARATYRGQVTKIANSATDYLKTPESRINESNLNRMDEIEEELTVFLERLTAAHQSLCKININGGDTFKAEDLKKECETIAEYEDKAVAVISRLKQRLSKLHSFRVDKPSLTNNAPVNYSAKLPKLALKTFSGDFKEWLPFWECFRAAVHERENLSECDKFNYLQVNLTGKAAESIAGFVPSAENYQAAISLLQEEYGDEERLVDHVMQQLMSLSHVHSPRDASGLRRLYNSVISHTRTLTAFGVPSSQYSVMLKTFLLKCLPDEMVVGLYRSHQDNSKDNKVSDVDPDVTSILGSDTSSKVYNGDRSVGAILKYLKAEVESLERSAQAHGKRSLQPASGKIIKTAAALLTPNEPIKCCFCGSDSHAPESCDAQMPIPQRKEILMKQGRCFRCLRKGHSSRGCRNNFVRCVNCKGRHPSCLCDPSYKSTLKGDPLARKVGPKSSTATSLCSMAFQSSGVYLQTACALASCLPISQTSIMIRLVLDGGSQRSYVTMDLVEKLGLPVEDQIKLRILPFGNVEGAPMEAYDRVKITLKSRFNERCSVSILAVVVPNICANILPVPSVKCPAFENLELADDDLLSIEGINVLIGADHYWEVVHNESRRLMKNLVAINTLFGWTLQGPVISNCNQETPLCSSVTTLSACVFEDAEVRRFWDLESVGISNIDLSENIVDNFDSYIQKSGERYEATLLWRNDSADLHDNRECAFKRFNKLISKLSGDVRKLLDYDSAMREFIDSGVAERVPEKTQAKRVFYLPHRPVYREDKTTTKLRIVFDASAHSSNALSLNQNLSAGPNLLPELLVMILNFRLGAIGLAADIEKAFLQISLLPEDRDVHRFLWFDNKITCPTQLPRIAIYRMTRVTFGVCCSPFLLCATLQKHFEHESRLFPSTCALLKRSFYMDDFVASTNDDKEAATIYGETIDILKRASMNIRKWNTNCNVTRALFNERPPEVQKLLGLIWSSSSDNLSVDFRELPCRLQAVPTKRNLLATIAKIFDPLGIFGPFVLKLKLLFQEIWRLRLEWDEPLPQRLQTVWSASLTQLPLLSEVTIPRWVFSNIRRSSQELHVFADASPAAYGAVSYVRSVNVDGSIHATFLCSRNRVAPIKEEGDTTLTLPKLELTAALVASRLAKFLKEKLTIKFREIFLWSDSKITLYWIHNDRHKYKPFIANRVREIKQLSSDASWRHCPGNENPADMLTRGMNAKNFIKAEAWINGPSWLSEKPEQWPDVQSSFENSFTSLALQATNEAEIKDEIMQLLPVENYSRYRKLLRITAYVLRFINCLRKILPQQHFLNAEELHNAELYWIKSIQLQAFSKEIATLKKGSPLPRSSHILTLNPMLDEKHILRIRSRLQESGYDYDEIFPILLPKSMRFTQLLVQDAHERTLHGGVNVILTRLRERFWIPKCRQLVKGVVKRCFVCLRQKGPPASQPTAPLPRERLRTSKPFESAGIDFMGPLYVKNPNNEAGTIKVYVMILTCAVLRAVHLELVPNLTTESCLSALRRFFARRGVPKCLMSDNARTFKRAALELRQLGSILDSEKMQDFISERGITWKFIVERAAWWGGFWERMVKLVKDNLKMTIGRAVLTAEQLQTFLVEVECTVNSRPLTYFSEDPIDLSPLTPNHFLKGSHTCILSTSGQATDTDIRAKWKDRLRYSHLFMKRFNREYIQRLRSAHHTERKFSSQLEVGEVIIVYDQLSPRLFWKLGVVVNVFPGRDGKVRSCEVRLSNGTILRRSIQHLYPLEIKSRLQGRPEDVKNNSDMSLPRCQPLTSS